MTDQRKQAADLARQILRDDRDLQWLAPLAREFEELLRVEERWLLISPVVEEGR